MILHPRFERLARFAARDGAADDRGRTAAHISACPRCRATVTWVRNARTVLCAADGPTAPPSAWARIQARIEAGDVVLLPDANVPRRDARRPGRRSRRIAIAASLVLVAGATAAVTSGPARQWLERSIAAIAAPARGGAESDDVAATDVARRTTVIVPAANGGVTVDINESHPALEVRIRTTDAPELEVEASGSAAAARFHSGTGRLTINEAGAGVLVVRLPHALDRATIGVDGQPYVIKRGDELRVLAPLADTAGSEIVLRPARVPSDTARLR